MLPSMMSAQSFTRRRYPKVNDHGRMVRDLLATPSLATFYGSVQPGSGTTDVVNRNGAQIVQTIFAQPGNDVEHDDLIDFGGRTYFVNGAPEQWRVGILDHDVISLSAWTE